MGHTGLPASSASLRANHQQQQSVKKAWLEFVLSIDDESKRGTTVLPVMVSLHHSIDRTLLHELFADQWCAFSFSSRAQKWGANKKGRIR